MNKVLSAVIATLSISFGMIGAANAGVIFEDDFSRDTVPDTNLNSAGGPGGWQEGNPNPETPMVKITPQSQLFMFNPTGSNPR